MVFADSLDEIVDTSFTASAGWSFPDGWTIANGVLTATDAKRGGSLRVGKTFDGKKEYTYLIKISGLVKNGAGVIPVIGDQSAPVIKTDGVFTGRLTPTSRDTVIISVQPDGSTNNLSAVIEYYRFGEKAPRKVLRPDEYTLSGNTITFNVPPLPGDRNIIIYAPSKLVGAVG